jgi:N-dimethylarginine dimethylaminohydrolase
MELSIRFNVALYAAKDQWRTPALAPAANALLLNNVVILPASFPKTCARLEKRRFRVRAIDVSELQKAEAGVTCCSLIFNSKAR